MNTIAHYSLEHLYGNSFNFPNSMFQLLNCVGRWSFENVGFQIPPEEKSHVDKSGVLVGHMLSPYLEITWLGKKLFTTAMEARAVWQVDPSYWKNVSSLTEGRESAGD
jgi:hypothetical protein